MIIPTILWKYGLLKKLEQTDLPQHNFETGIGYYINDNLKLDLSPGFDITKNADEHYFAIGVSFRFH